MFPLVSRSPRPQCIFLSLVTIVSHLPAENLGLLGVETTLLTMEAVAGDDAPGTGTTVNTPTSQHFVDSTYCSCGRYSTPAHRGRGGAPAHRGHDGNPAHHGRGSAPTRHGRGNTSVPQVGRSGSPRKPGHPVTVIDAEDSSDDSSTCTLWNFSCPSFIR